MGVQKNATYKVHNGIDFDEINFKTLASQVKMASGVDLETGFTSNKNSSGYTKLPNGLILAWVQGNITNGQGTGYVKQSMTLPITFNSILSVSASLTASDIDYASNSNINATAENTYTVTVGITRAAAHIGCGFSVWAIGY